LLFLLAVLCILAMVAAFSADVAEKDTTAAAV
jgi:hypothetical protein